MKPPTILVVPESEHDLVASLCVFRNGESSLSKRDQIEATELKKKPPFRAGDGGDEL
jgi:hypothetical protein